MKYGQHVLKNQGRRRFLKKTISRFILFFRNADKIEVAENLNKNL